MVIDKILTILDAVTAFVLATHVALGWFSFGFVISLALYIIVKGLIFVLGDFASKVDIVVGIYILLVALNIFSNSVLTIISVIWLTQKMLFIVFGLVAKIFF